MPITLNTPLYKRRPIEMGWQNLPRPADVVADLSTILQAIVAVPIGLVRDSYDGWTQSPLAANNEVSKASFEFGVYGGPDKNSYDGLTASPLVNSNEVSSSSTTFGVPLSRSKHPPLQFEIGPAIPVLDDLVSKIFDVPLTARPRIAEGFTFLSTNIPSVEPTAPFVWFENPTSVAKERIFFTVQWQIPLDVQDPVAGFTHFDLPPEGLERTPYSFIQAGIEPVVVEEVPALPSFLLPQTSSLPSFLFDGSVQSPLADDVVAPVADSPIFKPIFRPRRR